MKLHVVAHLPRFVRSGVIAWIGGTLAYAEFTWFSAQRTCFDLIQGWIRIVGGGVAGGALVRNGSGPAASLDDKADEPV